MSVEPTVRAGFSTYYMNKLFKAPANVELRNALIPSFLLTHLSLPWCGLSEQCSREQLREASWHEQGT